MKTPEARLAYNRAYRLANKDRLREAAKQYRLRHDPKIWSAKNRKSHLKVIYKLTPEEYETLLNSQNRACAICRCSHWNGKPPHIDHDHATGRVRGILCNLCNTAIGFIKENPTTAWAMADYLQRQAARNPRPLLSFGIKPMSKTEVAKFLNVSTHTIDNWSLKNQFPFVKTGGHRRYVPAEIEAWIAHNSDFADRKDRT